MRTLGVAVVLLLLVYWQILYYMVLHWQQVPDYNHGFLVAPLAVYFAYERKRRLRRIPIHGSWLGLIPLSVGLVSLAVGRLGVELTTMRSGFVFTLIGLVLLLLGKRMFRALAFPLYSRVTDIALRLHPRRRASVTVALRTLQQHPPASQSTLVNRTRTLQPRCFRAPISLTTMLPVIHSINIARMSLCQTRLITSVPIHQAFTAFAFLLRRAYHIPIPRRRPIAHTPKTTFRTPHVQPYDVLLGAQPYHTTR